jgi:hypothetical protein
VSGSVLADLVLRPEDVAKEGFKCGFWENRCSDRRWLERIARGCAWHCAEMAILSGRFAVHRMMPVKSSVLANPPGKGAGAGYLRRPPRSLSIVRALDQITPTAIVTSSFLSRVGPD